MNLSSHWSQAQGFTPKWVCTWRLKFPLVDNLALQRWQQTCTPSTIYQGYTFDNHMSTIPYELSTAIQRQSTCHNYSTCATPLWCHPSCAAPDSQNSISYDCKSNTAKACPRDDFSRVYPRSPWKHSCNNISHSKNGVGPMCYLMCLFREQTTIHNLPPDTFESLNNVFQETKLLTLQYFIFNFDINCNIFQSSNLALEPCHGLLRFH